MAIVQSTPVVVSASPLTLTFSANVTAGNAIIVMVNGASGSYSISDNRGNTYTRDATASLVANDLGVAIFCALNVAAGATTITLTLPAWSATARALEVSGLLTSATLDKTATNTDATGHTNPTSGTTAATTQADEFVVAVFCTNSGKNPLTITDPAGYTDVYQQTDGVTYFTGGAVQKTVAATGPQTATWTVNDTIASAGCIATYKLATSGTNFPRTLSASVAHSATVARAVANTRTRTSSIAHTAALTRAQTLTRGLSASIVHSTTVAGVKGFVRGLASSIVHSAAVTRATTATRTLASSIAHSAVVFRTGSFVRTLVSSIAHSAAFSYTLSGGASLVRTIASSIAHSTAATRALTLTRTLASSVPVSTAVSYLGQAVTGGPNKVKEFYHRWLHM